MKPKLRFQGFHDEWEEKKVSQFGKIITGNTPSKSHKEYYDINHGYPWITPTDITSSSTIKYSNLYLTDLGYSKARKLPKNTLLVTCIASIGKNTILKCEGSCNQQINAIIPNENYKVEFLYYLMEKYSKFLEQNAGQTATKILNKTDFSTLNLKVPSLPEQEKIGAFLSQLDDRIEKQEQKITLLKERKKGWMQQLFSQTIRFKDENGQDYPAWEEKKLGEVSETIKAGGTPKTTTKEFYNGDISFLTISDMTNNGKYIEVVNKSITTQGLESSSAWELPKNNLLLSMYASIGKVAQNLSAITFSQAIVGIILNNEGNKEYIYQYLNYLSLINYYDRYVSEGTQKNLNIQKVKNIEILLPSLPEQEKIAEFLSKQDELMEKEEEKLSLLKAQKKGLLQQMFV